MSNKPESSFWGRLRDFTKDSIDWQRIETLTANGVPDVNGCLKPHGPEFWVELKTLRREGSISLNSPIKPTQIAWLFRRYKSGGICHIMVECYDHWRVISNDEILLVDDGRRLPVGLGRRFNKPVDKEALLDHLIKR